MKKFNIVLFASAVAVSAVVCYWMHRHAENRKASFTAMRARQEQELAGLKADHERLSQMAAREQTASNNAAEIAGLKAEADGLQRKTNELARQVAASLPKIKKSPAQHSPEYYAQLRQMAESKSAEALHLVLEIQNYAEDHQDQVPTNVDDLAPYLARDHRSLSGSNQFEIVYHGSLADLKGVPWQNIAFIREQQVWPGPDGAAMRVYGMGGGIGRIVTSDDNFQSWEAKHVIPTAPGH